jgi:YYY domain-containing protein
MLTEPLWTLPDLNREAWGGVPGSSWLAFGLWLLGLVALTAAGLPWVLLLFRPLADAGVGLARPLAMLAIAWLVWMGASLRWTMFTTGAVVAATLAVGALGWLLAVRRGDVLATLRAQRGAILTSEAVFVAGFAVALGLRLLNPDLWQPWLGGEKPMESAFLNAVMRSAYFPPYDPWFSGGYINYYYFGYVLVGAVMKLVGVAPAIGFNLALATLFGMVAAGACSLGQTLARALAGRERAPATWLVSALGVGSAVLMVGIGNLDGFLQLLERQIGTLNQLDFWRSSRAIQYVIDEFPYFSFLYGDLHAHVLAMPLALLVVGCGLTLVLADSWKSPGRLTWGHVPWPPLVVSGLALGGLAVTNAWDVPAYTGVIAGASFIAAPFTRQAVVPRLLWAGAMGLLAAGLAYLLFLPFFLGFQSFYGSVGLTRIPTRLGEFLNMWGYFLALVALVTVVLLLVFYRSGGLRRLTWPVVLIVLVTALTTGAVYARGLPGVVIVAPLIGLLVLLWVANGLSPAGEFTLMLLIGALAIMAGVEFVFIVDFLQGGEMYRMNTVFKLYLESWLLLSVGLAGGAALVLREWPGLGSTLRGVIGAVAVGGLLVSLAYPIFLSQNRLQHRFDTTPGPTLNGLSFMETGILRDPNGAAIRLDEDLAAIHWMQENLVGAPVVAEAMIGPYRGNGARISNATGFPTILGWDNHEGQQRWPDQIGPRARDVRALYTSRTPEQALELIEKYDIDYIMLGQIEQLTTLGQGHLGATRQGERYASPQGLATLRGLAESGHLEEAFRQGDTVLYKVVRPLVFPGDR